MSQPDLLIISGDSIATGSSKTTNSWPYQLRTLLGDPWQVCMEAIGGTTSAQIYTQWQTFVRTALVTTPYHSPLQRRFVIHMPGINDLGVGTSAAATFTQARKVPDEVAADNANTPGFWTRCFFCTPAPCKRYWVNQHGQSTADTYHAAHVAYNAMVMGYSGLGVTPVNIYPLLESIVTAGYLKDGAGGDLDCATPNTTDNADYLHPNNLAASIIAAAIFQAMGAQTAVAGGSRGPLSRMQPRAGRWY